MAYTTINKSTDYFNTTLYTPGGGGGHTNSSLNFQPDWVWFKNRNSTESHGLYDAVRGVTKRIKSNSNAGETTESSGLTSFTSDGWVTGADGVSGSAGQNYASWNWKANGQGSANTDGSINSTVSANNTSGFSIVKYTGTGSAGNVGHGLSTAPTFLINKALGTQDWFVGCSALGFTKFLKLNATSSASTNSGLWNDTAPTTDHFTINSGNGNTNASGVDYITYCFAEKTGYSSLGSYIGNGNADGTFFYTGFKPAFLIVKNTAITDNWSMFNNKALGYNTFNHIMYPDLPNTESNGLPIDFLSNGFKWRTSAAMANGSGQKHIYMAFAEAPLVGSNNQPANAR